MLLKNYIEAHLESFCSISFVKEETVSIEILSVGVNQTLIDLAAFRRSYFTGHEDASLDQLFYIVMPLLMAMTPMLIFLSVISHLPDK